MTSLLRLLLVVTSSACATAPVESAAPAPAARAPDYDTLVKAAASYSATGRAQHAALTAERAAVLAPERPEAYAVWGKSLAEQNQLAEAAAKYEMARSRKSRDRSVFLVLASVYEVSKRYEDAIAVYRDYLRGTPNDAEMQQELGLTLLIVDRPSEAVVALRVAVQHGEGAQVARDLARALLRAGEPAEARAILRPLSKHDPTGEARLLLVQASAASGFAHEALQILDGLLERGKHDQALRMRAHLRLLTGAPETALDDFRVLIEVDPGDAAARLGAVGALVALRRLDEAAAQLEKAQMFAPNHPLVPFRAAQLAWRRGDKSAITRLAEFARANPGHVEAWREVYAATRQRDKKLAAEAKTRLTALGDAP